MASQKDELFGKIALEGDHVTQEQLDEALTNQRVMRESMGMHAALVDVLVHKRLLTKDQARDINHEVELRTGDVHLVAGYEVATKLGEGGMGAVYKARQVGTDDYVALKILPPSIADSEHINRFRREARIVRELDHDNIVRYVDFGRDHRRKCYYYAMELVEGEDLERRIERLGRLSEDEAVSITSQIAMALQHAFFHDLVHRDVKPSNIMVTPDGTAKLCDLGLARPIDASATRITGSGVAGMGTPEYMSPEHVLEERETDIRSDVYSLGATLYHMATGRPPFEGATVFDIVRKHLDEKAPWPADINPDLSEGLCRIIMKMMAKDSDDRYQEPNDLNDALDLLDVGQEPEIDDRVRATSKIALPARPAPERPAPPAAVRRRAVSRALARPRCHICGMSLEPGAVVRGGHLCPSCGTEVPVLPLIETREEGRSAVVVARGECSYDGFVRGLEPVIEAVVAKAPAEVVLDISGLSRMDVEASASHIVVWAGSIQARGAAFKVLCSGEALRRFEIIGLSQVIKVEGADRGSARPDRQRRGLASQLVEIDMEGPREATPGPAEAELRAVETPAAGGQTAAIDAQPTRPEGEAAGTPAEVRPSPVAETAHKGGREKEPRQHRRYTLPYWAKKVILLVVFLGVAAGVTVALTSSRRGGKTPTRSASAGPPAPRQQEEPDGNASSLPSRPGPSASAEPASPDESWQPIFNGRDMTGWEHVTGAAHVKHEALALEQYALVYYAAEWAEFVIECEITGAAAVGGGGGECVMGLGLACEGTEPHERRIDVVFMKDGTAEARVDDERKGEFRARFSLDEWVYVKLGLTRNVLELSGKDGSIGTVDVSGVPVMKGGIVFYSYDAAYAQIRNVRVRVLSP